MIFSKTIWCKIKLLLFFIPLITNVLFGQSFVNVAPELQVSAMPDPIEYGSGMSFYDFDNNGWDDLSFTMTDDSLIFYKNVGGTFELMPSIVYGEGQVKQLLWVDFNNDTFLDLAISTNLGMYKLWRNDGNFNFTDVSLSAGLDQFNGRCYGISFADYNRDGFVDLYVATYGPSDWGNEFQVLNHLYKNNGDETFTDVTLEAGVGDGNKSSFQGTWIDYNSDGWVDLFVNNDRVFENSLYENNGDGTFSDVSVQAGVGFANEDPMTCTVGDFNNDSHMDIYLTNTDQGPSLLLVNNGDETFTELAQFHNVGVTEWNWGAVWIDYDNDGLQDLYVSSGHWNANVVENFFFKNHSDFVFSQEPQLFLSNHVVRSFAPTRGDFDNNGYYDIAVLNEVPYDVLLWQNSGGTNNYLKCTLEGTVSNHFAIGSWIRLFVGGQQFTQFTLCGENYVSQNSQHHIFGIGINDIVDSVQVEYTSGHIDYYYNLAVNQDYLMVEGETYEATIYPNIDTLICHDDSLLLDAGTHHQLLWNTGSSEQFINVQESGLYWYVATNQYGVEAYSDTIEIQVSSEPDVSAFTQNPSCQGEYNGSIWVINNTTGIQQVSWDNNMVGDTIFGLNGGNYEYYLIDTLGCEVSGIAQLFEPFEINVQSFVTPDYGENDGTISLIINGGTPPYSITLNGEEVSTVINNLTAGTYQVVVTDNNDCEFITAIVVDLISSTIPSLYNSGVYSYPNPVNVGGKVKLSIGKTEALLDISIYDMSGRCVLVNQNVQPIDYEISIDLSSLTNGAYLIKLVDSISIQTIHLVIY